jgi:hypothetical protein
MVEQIKDIHEAQSLTTMKLSWTGIDLFININVRRLRGGSRVLFHDFFVSFVLFVSTNLKLTPMRFRGNDDRVSSGKVLDPCKGL